MRVETARRIAGKEADLLERQHGQEQVAGVEIVAGTGQRLPRGESETPPPLAAKDVDHVLDVLCILFIFAGLVLGAHMSPAIGAGFLLAYYLLMIEIALATHAVGTFRISFWKFGPTELRILLAIGAYSLDRVTEARESIVYVERPEEWRKAA